MYVSDRKTAGELRAIGEQRGWKPTKTISPAELQQFSSLEIQFHEIFSPEALKLALTEPKRKADEKTGSIKRMWTGAASTYESEAAWKTAEKFMELYPQVRATDTVTGAAFRKYLRANNLDPRELSSWETALQVLAATNQPEIFLSPKAAGVGPEEELGGYSLRSYPKLHLLLQRTPDEATRKFREAHRPELSADEFKKQHLQETGAPAYVKARIQKACDTLIAWHPDYLNTDDNIKLLVEWIAENKMQYDINGFEAAYHALSKEGKLEHRADAIVRAGEMTLTNYEPRETGQPEAPGKLRAKVARMSSSEMATFLRENPSARRAIDGM